VYGYDVVTRENLQLPTDLNAYPDTLVSTSQYTHDDILRSILQDRISLSDEGRRGFREKKPTDLKMSRLQRIAEQGTVSQLVDLSKKRFRLVLDDEHSVDPNDEWLFYSQAFFLDLLLVEPCDMGLDTLTAFSHHPGPGYTWNFNPRLGQREWIVKKVQLSFLTGQSMCCVGDLNGLEEVWFGFKPNSQLGRETYGHEPPLLSQATSRLSTRNYRKFMCFMAYVMSLERLHGVAMNCGPYPDINKSDVLASATNLV
jgi:hypothetical protein